MVVEATPSSQQTEASSASTAICDIVPRNLALELSQLEPNDADRALLRDGEEEVMLGSHEEELLPEEDNLDRDTERTAKTAMATDDEDDIANYQHEEEVEDEEEIDDEGTQPGTVVKALPEEDERPEADLAAAEHPLEVIIRLKPASGASASDCIRRRSDCSVSLVAPKVLA